MSKDTRDINGLFNDLENAFMEFLRTDPSTTTAVPATMAAQNFEVRFRTLINQAKAEAVQQYKERLMTEGISIAGTLTIPLATLTKQSEEK